MNKHEKEFKEELEAKGYKVLRNGWPDFLVQNPEGRVTYAVELKYGDDKLSAPQKEMHRALRKAGLHIRTHQVFKSLKKPPKKVSKKVSKKVLPLVLKPSVKRKTKSPRKNWLDAIAAVLDTKKTPMTTGEVEKAIVSRYPKRLVGVANVHGTIGSALDRARKGSHPRIRSRRMSNGRWTYWTVKK